MEERKINDKKDFKYRVIILVLCKEIDLRIYRERLILLETKETTTQFITGLYS